MKKLKVLDILLFPKSIYRKLNDRKMPVFAGMFIVGIIDVVLPLLFNKSEVLFKRGQADLTFNIAAILVCSAVVGAIDIIFFALPLHDLFDWIGKKSNVKFSNNSIVKIIKIYLLAHVFVIPVNIIFNLLWLGINAQSLPGSISVSIFFIYYVCVLYFNIIMPIWFSAVIYRGISTIYDKFTLQVKGLVFIAIFLWNNLLSYALSFIVNTLLLKIFR